MDEAAGFDVDDEPHVALRGAAVGPYEWSGQCRRLRSVALVDLVSTEEGDEGQVKEEGEGEVCSMKDK